MRWSWKICQFRGIGVYVPATFLILIAFMRSLGSRLSAAFVTAMLTL